MPHIECVIVGGPEHGLILRRTRERRCSTPLSIICADGHSCIAALRRRGRTARTRYLMLHPHATGEQIRSMLAP